ncbi:unnamed protein product [Zymoseptoria tritici ST99CH_1A5]|uniref:ADF-H domain-containing protein n=3 Tax=Zymoseptoria tritici TaxID=1047171 RepID=A0A1X7S3N9_ZYMT9|nr:unnamed protein product [Zymoseptoria tritici ST99CH_3D7]SMR58247.1 unnamed protein product [Zymoseptoria tritici ST99CH_1E4]SMR61222.1 unnamed protein product [Zymoseptoria tritici ST99CH_3D1]SMY27445.1 unnamed protein product [Zymoseptoria tritici ST99CH_1A5]
MASESRLYTISPSTRESLRKFRLSTSRAKDPQAMIYHIDSKTMEILPVDSTVYTTLQDIADELPDNSPRYVLLSYPLTMKSSGRMSVPYVMLNFMPPTCSSQARMLYAGAKELMKNSAEVGRILEVESGEEVEGVEERLQGEE